MNKEEVKSIIKELRVNRPLLNKLESIAWKYKNSCIEHGLDGNILFELELLHEKLTTILYLFYLGDAEKDWREGKITMEEWMGLVESKKGKSMLNDSPYFNFGYMNSDFISTFERINI